MNCGGSALLELPMSLLRIFRHFERLSRFFLLAAGPVAAYK